ncbi:nitroreductase family protein [Romboutsia sp. 1001713B170207_170306_H8]|uniref:nitroreductase family protein n=1 Tax=Romboutsia sp. 1001713B170207_170306_H8 TaxID=2787112 RepID=UPI0008230AC8|nr:nitroreductase family protein [Romboutsia sp. 1001713B170207_170306_H8]SCH45580.1 FMN reductase [NAD(P)H] [uncultured Clostridium sp.]
MNEVIQTINKRVSLRKYQAKNISKEHIDIIIDSAIKAPTAGNMMMYSILKIQDEKTKEILSKSCDNQPLIKKAPLILIFLADMQKWYDYYKLCNIENIKYPGMNDFMLSINDAIIACENAVLASESLGIGSCYIGDIMENYEVHKELLNLPNYTFPAAMITLGYYPENIKRIYRERFKKDYVVFDEKYRRLDDKSLIKMFEEKEENMPKYNAFNAKNFGELTYKRKTSADFSIEMDRSIKKWIKSFTNYLED